MMAHEARYSEWECCSKGDVVAVRCGGGWLAAKIWLFLSVAGEPIAIASLMQLVRRDPESSTWRDVDDAKLVDLTDILVTFVFADLGGEITVLHRYSLRG